jgi:two-component system, sensor histidine kinase ChiS
MKLVRTCCIFVVVTVLLNTAECFAQQDITLLVEKARTLVKAGAPDSGLAFADSALRLAEKQGNIKGRVQAMTVKGKALFTLNKNKEAADEYFGALKLCKAPADNKEIALLYSEIAYTYFSQGHYSESKEYYEKELAIRLAMKGPDSLGNQLINLSVMHQDLKEYDSAFIALNRVAAILSHTSNPELAGYYYLNRGALLQFMGNRDSASFYYHKAYDMWKSVGNKSQLYKTTFNLGYLEEEKKNFAEAIRYYRLSEDAARKFGFQREIAHVYGTMAEAYAAIKDYRNAYDCLYKYATLSDSLSKADFNNYVVKLDKQFQTGKSRELIREQRLKLDQASLLAQKQQNRMLIIVVVLIAVVLLGVIFFSYFTFQNRVSRQVEIAKRKFFDNVVHEIRTPLSMIQGPIKVLQSKLTDESARYQLNIAERNTNRLNELISQMLDISKLDAAKYQLNPGLGNPMELIEEVARQYEQQAKEKNIQFFKQVDADCGTVFFDKDALEKVIGNLLSNAIKYTAAGGSAGIDVSAINGGEAAMLSVNVWDTGPGIDKKDQDKIFERFYRGKTQQATATKGVGIGLSLVRDLVSLMNGTIGVESDSGKGTVFTVILPLKAAMQPKTGIRAGDTDGDVVLLVEDDADILDFNKTLLLDKGFNVITATNGIEALEAIKRQLPDIIVTDLMMPGMDGLTLLKYVRTNPASDHIPVIILSAKASVQSKIEGVTEGAQVYLPKPFQPDELVALIKNQLHIIQKQKAGYQEKSSVETQTIEERFAGADPFTKKCYLLIREHLDDAQFSVEKLAELMFVNRSHFQRKMKTLTGYSPSELIRTIRLEKAREMLSGKEGNITEIAYSTGFTSQSYFTKCFTEHFGYPPSHELKPEGVKTAEIIT